MSLRINAGNIKQYFGEKLEKFGATPRGADWNSETSQTLRFEQLARVIQPGQEPFSLLDYGCGYGGLVDFLLGRGHTFTYTGYDLLDDMVVKARQIHQARPFCTFTSDEAALPEVDYTIASGIFNIKFEAGQEEWTAEVLRVLERMDALSRRGFAFNMLTSYSDAGHMRPDLYYGDPCFFFDTCKRRFSRNVALLHDYDLYDFTILVRK